jgi:hypothetical protein
MGVWSKILEALIAIGYSNGKLRLDKVAVDRTAVKACKEGELIGYDGYWRVKGTKIHVAVTGESLPISLVVGPGGEHDSRRFKGVMNGIRVRYGGGRPRTRPREVTIRVM